MCTVVLWRRWEVGWLKHIAGMFLVNSTVPVMCSGRLQCIAGMFLASSCMNTTVPALHSSRLASSCMNASLPNKQMVKIAKVPLNLFTLLDLIFNHVTNLPLVQCTMYFAIKKKKTILCDDLFHKCTFVLVSIVSSDLQYARSPDPTPFFYMYML